MRFMSRGTRKAIGDGASEPTNNKMRGVYRTQACDGFHLLRRLSSKVRKQVIYGNDHFPS
jgi:hypothetical protein